MKTFITILFVLCAAIVSAQVKTIAAENITITGVITDSEGIPIPGVSVIIEGKSEGVLTDFDGNYTINAKEGEKLVASFIGMTEETITISKQITIDFKLRDDPSFIENTDWNDRCYAPYIKNRKKITAISSVNRPNEEFIKMLQEKKTAISIGCTPDLSETIIIRCSGSINGNHEPLYVIDGYPLNADNFKEVNPDDIISINVLKDARATSIYGNRGEYGVIIVKTKNGLTKKEKRKLKRAQKEKDRTQTTKKL